MGQNLLSLSPAFLRVRPSIYLAAAALVSILPLTVYASGFSQFGVRYYVEVFPFLIAAMNAIPKEMEWRRLELSTTTKVFIGASMALTISQTLIVWAYGLA